MNQQSLIDLQQQLQHFLLDKSQPQKDITLETPRFKRDARLDIYYQAYRLRLIEALENDFPALRKLWGDEQFSKVCLAYIDQYPSQHPSLRWLGQHFVDFLIAHNESVLATDLARFEWAQVTAFDVEDLPTIDDSVLKTLAPQDWMQLSIQFHPSLQLLALRTQAPQVWLASESDDDLQSIEIHSETSDIEQDWSTQDRPTQDWIVWRKELKILFQSIDAFEKSALVLFQEGHHLLGVMEQLSEDIDEEQLAQLPMQLATYLQHWIKRGLVIGVDY